MLKSVDIDPLKALAIRAFRQHAAQACSVCVYDIDCLKALTVRRLRQHAAHACSACDEPASFISLKKEKENNNKTVSSESLLPRLNTDSAWPARVHVVRIMVQFGRSACVIV